MKRILIDNLASKSVIFGSPGVLYINAKHFSNVLRIWDCYLTNHQQLAEKRPRSRGFAQLWITRKSHDSPFKVGMVLKLSSSLVAHGGWLPEKTIDGGENTSESSLVHRLMCVVQGVSNLVSSWGRGRWSLTARATHECSACHQRMAGKWLFELDHAQGRKRRKEGRERERENVVHRGKWANGEERESSLIGALFYFKFKFFFKKKNKRKAQITLEKTQFLQIP